ncbi:unnamed protein product, partial [Polarella glacialis]
ALGLALGDALGSGVAFGSSSLRPLREANAAALYLDPSAAVDWRSQRARGPKSPSGSRFAGGGCSFGGALAGLSLALFGVARWLQEPKNLDEAYGLRKDKVPRPGSDQKGRGGRGQSYSDQKGRGRNVDPEQDEYEAEEKQRRPVEMPAMQQAFRSRMKQIEPYKDIVKQVEQNCHGKGGWRKAKAQEKQLMEIKPGQKKPAPPTDVDVKATQLQFSKCWRYARAGLHEPNQWPEADPAYPEVAFVGRSNVGKSSLLNQICNFGTIAAVSSKPGRTKHAAWYRNRKVHLDIIDMPGYGHADRAKVFGPEALAFVKARTSLKAVYILIDARHGFKWTDHEWLAELGNEGPRKQVILTKCDMVA